MYYVQPVKLSPFDTLIVYVTISMKFFKLTFGADNSSSVNNGESNLTPQQCLGMMNSFVNFLRYPPDDVEEGFLEMVFDAYDEMSINLRQTLIRD